MAPVPWRRETPRVTATPCLEDHPIWSVPMVWGGGEVAGLVSCWVSKVANCFVVAEIGGMLGGSSQLGSIVNNHGDRKSPNWSYSRCKWPFHRL